MSLYITVQVTKTPIHLDQIHQVTITNLGIQEAKHGILMTRYRVSLDGKTAGFVWHEPGDGALVLMEKAMYVVNHSE